MKWIQKIKDKFYFKQGLIRIDERFDEYDFWMDYFNNGPWRDAFTEQEREDAIAYLNRMVSMG